MSDAIITPTDKPNRFKALWNAHKGKIAVAATLTTIGLAALNARNLKLTQEFLDENDLNEKFDEFVGVDEDPDQV